VVIIVTRLSAGWPRVQLLAWSTVFSPEHPDCLPRGKVDGAWRRLLTSI
jgi:hypothetical protein